MKKVNPLTQFRKNYEDREKKVLKSYPKYGVGGPYESFDVDDVQRPVFDTKWRRHSPKTTSELVDEMDLRNTKGHFKNASYAKSSIKRRLGDGSLLKGSPEHIAIKKIFKEEKKKGSYNKDKYKFRNA